LSNHLKKGFYLAFDLLCIPFNEPFHACYIPPTPTLALFLFAGRKSLTLFIGKLYFYPT
jgi:hypothetical protein